MWVSKQPPISRKINKHFWNQVKNVGSSDHGFIYFSHILDNIQSHRVRRVVKSQGDGNEEDGVLIGWKEDLTMRS